MTRTLSILDAQHIGLTSFDVVDVREPDEFARGHLPGARSVPLSKLTESLGDHLPRDKVLFVCAKGMRSQVAASAAEKFGLGEVYSLEGGTLAWESAGLPVERPAPPAAVAAPRPLPVVDDSVSPELDAIVAVNMGELRRKRGMSLDELAGHTGLSRTLLGQIENGRTSPSVSMVWKIARVFDVPFSALLVTDRQSATTFLAGAKAKRLVSPDGRFSSRALFPAGESPNVEFYELFLAAHSREDAEPHRAGTRENLVVTAGRLDLELPTERFNLEKGDAIAFSADVPHAYVNPGRQECWMYLVMTYS
ncbi:MAG: helix-turn-helix domain-containing protein [Deltaproteobacteria bacterium]|nr:helix-turn-helix domain-containing protein [Deltaproteobacteria bacterium]